MNKILTKALSCVLALLLVVGMVPITAHAADNENWADFAAAAYEGGSGTKDDPYQIATPEQLAKLAVDTNSRVVGVVPESKDYFILTQNIDLAGKLWTPIGSHMGNNSMSSFCGHFDGNDKTIFNMTVDMRGRTPGGVTPSGLFGAVTAAHSDYTIRNVNIKDATVYAAKSRDTSLNEDANAAGTLVGTIAALGGGSGNPIIKDCTVSNSKVVGLAMAGGLIGNASYCDISGCKLSGVEVTGNGRTAGLVGNAFLCPISNCNVNATASGTWSVGGFGGVIWGGQIENCQVSGKVTATDWNCGGFAGYMEAHDTEGLTLKNCTTEAAVESKVSEWEPRVGSFAGHIFSVSEMSECVALGEVTYSHASKDTIGKFAGVAKSDLNITDCKYNNQYNKDLDVIGNGTVYDAAKIGPYYAEYDKVDAAIAEVSNYNENLYKNFQAVTDAVNAVERDKKADEQAVVDGYAATIKAALAALEYKDADYSAVDAAIAEASKLNKDDYKDFSAVTNAINAVERGKNITEQSTVDGYASAIKAAIAGLESKTSTVTTTGPKIIEGANQKVEQGKEAAFRSSAELRDFVKVLLDGVEVARNNYTLKEGSTIVIFTEEFMKTLSVGTHTLSIVSTTGAADTQFTITQSQASTPAEVVKAPKTGDDSVAFLWMAMLLASASGVYLLSTKRKQSVR